MCRGAELVLQGAWMGDGLVGAAGQGVDSF